MDPKHLRLDMARNVYVLWIMAAWVGLMWVLLPAQISQAKPFYVDGNEPNNTPAQATLISYTFSYNNDIDPAGDVDYFKFTGHAGDAIIADIDANVLGSLLDSYLILYDTDGVSGLISNDDDGSTSDSWLEYTLPADGTYYLRVHDKNGGSGPNYFYSISLQGTLCADPNEPNGAWGQATVITYGEAISNPVMCTQDDADYYAFTGSVGDVIVADVDADVNGSSLDSYLMLYDTDGVSGLASNGDDGSSLDSRIEYTLPADGTYYLSVQDELGHYGPTYFYTLSLQGTLCTDPNEPNPTWGQATTITYGLPITTPIICRPDDVDYYAFSGHGGDIIVADVDADVNSSLLDSYLMLYDTDGVSGLASNGDDGISLDSRIEYTLPADGTYYLSVLDEFSHYGPTAFYTLSVKASRSVVVPGPFPLQTWYPFDPLCGGIYFTDTHGVTNITVTLTYDYPSRLKDGLPRRFDISANVNSGFQAMLALCYEDTELAMAGIDPSQEINLHLYRYVESNQVWQEYSIADPVNNLVTATLVSDFGIWGIGVQSDHPTAIQLQALAVHSNPIAIGLAIGILVVGLNWAMRRKSL